MATFGGVTFKLLAQGSTYGSAATVNVESLPESAIIVIDIGGAGEERIAGTCLFTTFANLLTMIGYAQTGASGTLAYTEQSRPAILVACQRTQIVPASGGTHKHLARCEWILTG